MEFLFIFGFALILSFKFKYCANLFRRNINSVKWVSCTNRFYVFVTDQKRRCHLRSPTHLYTTNSLTEWSSLTSALSIDVMEFSQVNSLTQWTLKYTIHLKVSFNLNLISIELKLFRYFFSSKVNSV